MKTNYTCSICESSFTKWFGKCPECGEWNTLEETAVAVGDKPAVKIKKQKTFNEIANSKAEILSSISYQKQMRYSTGINEFDRVLGGGIVKGSVVLLTGEPGIGKSTLLLQICQIVDNNLKIMYISGEESSSQLKMRANRLGVNAENVLVLCETNINKLIPEININNPDIVIVDSIQTIYDDEISPAPGSVTQVKQTTSHLIKKAKEDDISILIVGHVNKDGAIAGPKVLEHMVDSVLYFEGDKHHSYRLIRAAKNRFGSTNEIGVFEMCSEGLVEVPNPSEALISERPDNVSGSCAVCVIEGTRPLIAEIQALCSTTVFPAPRRVSNGIDYNRINLILAVLEKRLGLKFSANDVYINVTGGLKLEETASDMSIAIALISSYKNIVVPKDLIAFGEIGLSGECRSVRSFDIRINEAIRLGFKNILMPSRSISKTKSKYNGVSLIPIRGVFDLLNYFQ